MIFIVFYKLKKKIILKIEKRKIIYKLLKKN